VFCHGYENKDLPSATIGASMQSYHNSLMALNVASTVQLFPDIDSPDSLPADLKRKLEALEAVGVRIMPYQKVVKITPTESNGVEIHLSDGSSHKVSWILYTPKTTFPMPELISQLGLELNPVGDIKVYTPFQETNVPGVFAAGDCASLVKHIPGAVAEGARAGGGIHLQLAIADSERCLRQKLESR
jgi:gliotoxin/aspirochlorine biosynthesis thioredoxin reductase